MARKAQKASFPAAGQVQDLPEENRYGNPLLLLPKAENLLKRLSRKRIMDTPPLTGGEEKDARPFVGTVALHHYLLDGIALYGLLEK